MNRIDEIGEYVSALANSAALHSKPAAYMLWGVDDQTRRIVGTNFRPQSQLMKQQGGGKEEIENWLRRQLRPSVQFEFHEAEIEDKHVVLMRVLPASTQPVRFCEYEYIRIGSYKQKLRDFPEKQAELWNKLNTTPYELRVARSGLTEEDVFQLLDFRPYYKYSLEKQPDSTKIMLNKMCELKVVLEEAAGVYSITMMGAILFARDLPQFPALTNKGLRVVHYSGRSTTNASGDTIFQQGYAVCYRDALSVLHRNIPARETYEEGLRIEQPVFPHLSVRELFVNALMHQDLSVTGVRVSVEIRANKITFTNPGKPEIDVLRFLDHTPKSRNENMAKALHLMRICEVRGDGFDRVIEETEKFHLPAPAIKEEEFATSVTISSAVPVNEMNMQMRALVCYYHACFLYEAGQFLTNSSLRERLGIDKGKHYLASRIISAAINESFIKYHSGDKKNMKYAPHWS